MQPAPRGPVPAAWRCGVRRRWPNGVPLPAGERNPEAALEPNLRW